MPPLNWEPKGLLDPYERAARLYPGLLVVMPISILLICLYGSGHPWASTSVSVLAFCGAGYALGRASRDAGKRIQEDLFLKWGGPPTTQLLRHRDLTFDPHTKARYHAVISRGLKLTMPTPEEERANPAAADELYRSATGWLIDQTRDAKAYPLVFKENIAYGFQRNSLGIRPSGIIVAVFCMAWVSIHAHIFGVSRPHIQVDNMQAFSGNEVLALTVAALTLIYWLGVVTKSAVKRTAFAYAERLIQSCDRISNPSTSRTPRRRTGSSP
jgi:hypothetical protein